MKLDQRSIGRFWRFYEAPTWLLIAGVYGTWAALTWFYQVLPWWFLLPAGGYVVALHGSLQHELLHGHPTRWKGLNGLLARPSLWLWLPYGIYRDSHIVHHRTERLTCPLDDPESTYILAEDWGQLGDATRRVHRWRKTLLGRMLLGPAVATWRVAKHEAPLLLRGDARAWRQWAAHALATAPVLWWALAVCDIPLWAYVAFFAYPGLALALVRSFAEHAPVRDQARATAVVEASWPLAFLFLNNNLHALHHERPAMAWFLLPAAYRAERTGILKRNGFLLYKGYRQIFARYLVRPIDQPVHPIYASPRS